MKDENGENGGRRRRNRNASIGGLTPAEQEVQEQVEETDAIPQHADSLDDLLRGIYSSVVEAQNTIEQHYIGEISEDYFDEEDIIRGFLIEKGTKGFSTSDIHGKMSLRASITSELFMKDVCIPDSNRLPNVEGLKGPLSCLNQARYSIVWGTIGAAVDCYEVALNYSKERKQFSKPIAQFQLTQQKLAYMIQEISKAQLLAIQLGRLKDTNKVDFSHISLGKKNNVAIARKCAKLSREILGANGIMDDYSVMRHMMNLETVYTYEGTNEIHTLIIGQEITGESAFE